RLQAIGWDCASFTLNCYGSDHWGDSAKAPAKAGTIGAGAPPCGHEWKPNSVATRNNTEQEVKKVNSMKIKDLLILSYIDNLLRNITGLPWILLRARLPIAICLLLVPASIQAMTTNVVFKNFSFTPQTVTIQVGDTILWTNAGGTHTVTGDGADPFCGPGVIGTSCSETFTTVG